MSEQLQNTRVSALEMWRQETDRRLRAAQDMREQYPDIFEPLLHVIETRQVDSSDDFDEYAELLEDSIKPVIIRLLQENANSEDGLEQSNFEEITTLITETTQEPATESAARKALVELLHDREIEMDTERNILIPDRNG